MKSEYMATYIYHLIIFFELAIVFNSFGFIIPSHIISMIQKLWVRYLYISKESPSKDTMRCETMHAGFQFSLIYKGILYMAAK